MTNTVAELKSKIHPNVLALINDQITPEVVPGYTQTSSDSYYGAVVFRVVAVVSQRDITGFQSRWHPAAWAGGWSIRELVVEQGSDRIPTHLVVSLPLLEDNQSWTAENTDYAASCAKSTCKPQKVLPIAVTAKVLLKWYKLMDSYIISKYPVDNLAQSLL
jgi:hypothetical protein